jgi:cyclopropane fatty-acyl-phospholipid synthase-like methyltransferase
MAQVKTLSFRVIVFAMLTMLLGATPLRAQHGDGHSHSFSDTQKWSASFDDPERDKWQMPDRLIAALELRPTDLVADLGAGTGYLAVRIARQSGTVFAVDVEPKMVQHLAERAKAAGIGNLRAVEASEASPNLP